MTSTAWHLLAVDEYVVREGRLGIWRYWLLMFLLLIVAPGVVSLVNGDGISSFRVTMAALWAALGAFLVFGPKAVFARIDESGVTMRKAETLKWKDIERIELGKMRSMANVFRWTWGDDKVLRFVPTKKAAARNGWFIKRRARQLGSPYGFAGFQTAQSLDEIADACTRYTNVKVVEAD